MRFYQQKYTVRLNAVQNLECIDSMSASNGLQNVLILILIHDNLNTRKFNSCILLRAFRFSWVLDLFPLQGVFGSGYSDQLRLTGVLIIQYNPSESHLFFSSKYSILQQIKLQTHFFLFLKNTILVFYFTIVVCAPIV